MVISPLKSWADLSNIWKQLIKTSPWADSLRHQLVPRLITTASIFAMALNGVPLTLSWAAAGAEGAKALIPRSGPMVFTDRCHEGL